MRRDLTTRSIILEMRNRWGYLRYFHYTMLQKSNWDFMSPIRIQLTYDLTDVGVPTLVSRTRLPDINNYPVVNNEKAEKNFSVSISFSFLVLFFAHTHSRLTALCQGLPESAATSRNVHPLTPIPIVKRPLSTCSIYYDP